MSMLSRFPTTATAGIQYVGGTTAQITGSTATTTNVSLTGLTGGLAAAPATGDVVVVYYGVSSTADRTLTITTSGYVTITDLYANDTYDSNFLAAYKIIGAAPDTQVTVSATGATTDSGAVAVQVWRYVDPYLPLDTPITAGSIGTVANTVLCNPQPNTPTTAGAIIIAGGAGAHSRGVQTYSSSDLSNFLTIGGPDNNNDVTIGMGSRAGVSGTSFNPAAFTFSSTDSTQFSYCTLTMGLRFNQNQPGPIAISSSLGQHTGAARSTVTVDAPLGIRENDLLVGFFATTNAATWTGATGWTEVADQGSTPSVRVAYKIATASEPASYIFTVSVSGNPAGAIVVYRNAAYDAIGTITTAANPLVVSAVTASVPFARILGFAARNAINTTITGPASMQTLALDATSVAPSFIVEQDNSPSLSGSSGTRSFTVGSITDVAGVLVSIKPAASYTKYAQYIASTSATANATTTVTVNTPSRVPGNLLLYVVTVGVTTAIDVTVATPSGWELLSGNSTNTTAYQPGMYVFFRVADGSESSTYTATASTTTALCGSIICLADVNALTLTAGTTNTGSATTSISANGVNATTNGVLLYFGCQANNNQGAVTFTPPSGMTEAGEASINSGTIDMTLEVAYQEGLTAGATGSKTATASAALGTNLYRAILVTVDAL